MLQWLQNHLSRPLKVLAAGLIGAWGALAFWRGYGALAGLAWGVAWLAAAYALSRLPAPPDAPDA